MLQRPFKNCENKVNVVVVVVVVVVVTFNHSAQYNLPIVKKILLEEVNLSGLSKREWLR